VKTRRSQRLFRDLVGDSFSVTTMDPDPESPVDDDGLMAVIAPKNEDVSTEDTEDNDAFEALREDLSPGEAQRALDTMRPLSEDEEEILEDTPGLEGLHRVDDAEQNDWIINKSKRGRHAMDEVLDDASYGETMTHEEKLERAGRDSDVGFGFRGLARGLRRGIGRVARAPLSAARFVGRGAMRFIPGRDAQKARIVRNLYNKLVVEHANYLANQDQAAGNPVQPMLYYQAQSKPWAIAQIKAGGMPTSYVVSGADVLGAEICGSDVMGTWWNPISWFFGQSQVVVNNTQGARSATGPDGSPGQMLGPDGQPLPQGQGGAMPDGSMPPGGPGGPGGAPDGSMMYPGGGPGGPPDASMMPPDGGAPYGGPMPYGSPDGSQGDFYDGVNGSRGSVSTGVMGADSLGAVTREVLGAAPAQTATPKDDQMMIIAVKKLRSGHPLTPGEFGLVGRLAKNGNPLAKKVYAMLLTGGVTKISGGPGASKEDQVMAIAVKKLRSGYPLQPGEFAIVARLAKTGNPTAKQVYATLMTAGVTKIHGVRTQHDVLGDWLYKLNPLRYVFKSQEERGLEDKERTAWSENAELREKLAKRQKVLTQAEKARAAADAVQQAKDQAVATEAQLKEIETSLAGEVRRCVKEARLAGPAEVVPASDSMGHEKPTAISTVIQDALDKAGKRRQANAIYATLQSGRGLSPDQLAEAKQIADVLHQVKVVHGDIWEKTPAYLSGIHGAFVGACLAGDVRAARQRNLVCGKAAVALSHQVSPNRALSPEHEKAIVALGAESKKLRGVVGAHVSGRAYRHLSRAKQLQQTIMGAAAAAAMTPAEAKMLQAVQSLAKAGNPRAIYGLQRLKETGMISGGDYVGLSFGQVFKYATAPVWLPAYGLYKGTKWTGQKVFGGGGGGSNPEQARLARMRAAAQRQKAAEAKAAAADAQTEAELRAQQAIADAAQAEADAADAAALQKEAAMKTAELEANPEQALKSQDDGGDTDQDSSGEFAGEWDSDVGTSDKKILKAAGRKNATGMKIRAGAKFYKKLRAGDPQAKASLRNMIARSQKGDKQATRDLRAAYAGMHAQKAKEKAQLAAHKKHERQLAANARKLKVIAAQKNMEVVLAKKLARAQHAHELHKLAKVEHASARGNPKARKYVNQQVKLAKAGDKGAKKRVAGMKLARHVRTVAPTAREQHNLAQARKLVRRANKNDPSAIRQIGIVSAAAKAGNPNAKRAKRRLETAQLVELTLATGSVAAATAAVSKKHASTKKESAKKKTQLAKIKTKYDSRTGTREEYAAGAKIAQETGDKKLAGELAMAATAAPSATESLQKTAALVQAKNAGNPQATKEFNESFEAAKTGDPDKIKDMGKVVATHTLADANEGQEISPAMRDAVNLQERAAAKDPAAIETSRQISEAATVPNPTPEATAAAISLAAAAIIAQTMAAKPKAREEFLEKVNPPLSAAEKTEADKTLAEAVEKAQAGTITAAEAVAAERLAERARKPKLAAQIAALSPPPPPATPMSTLPETPQAPITGLASLARESLRALTFSTRDPLANWREGVASRSATPVAPAPAAQAAGCDKTGWSPFEAFKRNLSIILPGISAATSTASLVLAASARKEKGKGVAPAAAAAAPAAPATAAASAAPTASAKPAAKEPAPQAPSEAPRTEAPKGGAVDVELSSVTSTSMGYSISTANPRPVSPAAKAELQDAVDALTMKDPTVSALHAMLLNRDYDGERKTYADLEKRTAAGDQKAIQTSSLVNAIQLLEAARDGGSLSELTPIDTQPLADYVQCKKGNKAARARAKENLERAQKGSDLDALKYAISFRAHKQIDDVLQNRPSAKQEVDRLLLGGTRASLRPEAISGAQAPAPAAGPDEATKFVIADTFKQIVGKAVAKKRISRDDFNRAAQLRSLHTRESKEVAAGKLLTLLTDRGVRIDAAPSSSSGAFVGADKTFKDYVVAAVKAKKMSRKDFNAAIAVHVKKDANDTQKQAAGKTLLAFLQKKGVKVET